MWVSMNCSDRSHGWRFGEPQLGIQVTVPSPEGPGSAPIQHLPRCCVSQQPPGGKTVLLTCGLLRPMTAGGKANSWCHILPFSPALVTRQWAGPHPVSQEPTIPGGQLQGRLGSPWWDPDPLKGLRLWLCCG